MLLSIVPSCFPLRVGAKKNQIAFQYSSMIMGNIGSIFIWRYAGRARGFCDRDRRLIGSCGSPHGRPRLSHGGGIFAGRIGGDGHPVYQKFWSRRDRNYKDLKTQNRVDSETANTNDSATHLPAPTTPTTT